MNLVSVSEQEYYKNFLLRATPLQRLRKKFADIGK